MSDDSFEPPWNGNNPLHESVPDNPVIGDVICKLEYLFRLRRKLSCPNDDIDNRILTVIRRALDSSKLLTERHEFTDTRKHLLIKNSRLLIKEANDVIEKTLRIRPYRIT